MVVRNPGSYIICRCLFLLPLLFSVFLNDSAAQIVNDPNPLLHGYKKGSGYMVKADSALISFLSKGSSVRKHGALQFAVPFDLDLSPAVSGVVFSENGMKIWSIMIKSPGAQSLGLVLHPCTIPPGGRVVVYTPCMKHIRGAFTELNNSESAALPVMPLPGDEIILEFQVPENVDIEGLVSVARVAHGYLDLFGDSELKDGRYGTSQPCNVDISCDATGMTSQLKRSVCRLIINGVELCSGVMLNSTDPNGKPILLTASHCISNAFEAERTLFVFNYESPWCDGPDGSVSQSLAGSAYLTGDSFLDFTLVTLSDHPPITYRPWYAGWDITGSVPPSTFTIHHPSGDVKKITSDNDAPETGSYLSFERNAFWKVLRWESGATEGGSSGAPLFTPEGLVTGILSGGSSICGNPVNDYFLKLNSAYVSTSSAQNSLRSCIDPEGIGFLKLRGRDPYMSNNSKLDTLRNLPGEAERIITPLAIQGSGYTTGFSIDSITGFGEFLANATTRYLLEIIVNPAVVRYQANSDSLRFRIQVAESGTPGQVLAERFVPLNAVRENQPLSIHFDNPVKVEGDFYITWELSYLMPVFPDYRQFAVWHSPDFNDPVASSAWFFAENEWSNFLQHPSMPGSYSFDVAVVLAESAIYTGFDAIRDYNNQIVICPNPVTSSLNLEVMNNGGQAYISIVDATGRTSLSGFYYPGDGNRFHLSVGHLLPGLYIVVVEQSGKRLSARFLKSVR